MKNGRSEKNESEECMAIVEEGRKEREGEKKGWLRLNKQGER